MPRLTHACLAAGLAVAGALSAPVHAKEADVSNDPYAWLEEVEGQKRTRIVRDEVRYTTLERSVEGLTGGKPVPLPVFETRITDKIVHPVPITEPVEDGLPLENGNGSDAAN